MIDQHELSQRLRQFADERDWQPYHTPKNLVMAMSVEMAELLEHFQWLTPEQANALHHNPASKTAVAHEMADVLLYLLRLADVMEVDLSSAIEEKLRLNAEKYPATVPGNGE